MNASEAWPSESPKSVPFQVEPLDPLARPHAFLRGIAGRMDSAVPFDEVLAQVVEFVTSVVACDSCFVYVHEGNELVLRASKNQHPEVVNRLKLRIGQGITGWVAQHRHPVAVTRNASRDARFQLFNELPEDRFEAFLSVPLLSRGCIVGVVNLQSRAPHAYTEREITLISTIGFLVGAEIEMARLEKEKSELADRLELRKLVERAKGILQKEMKIPEPEAYEVLQRQSQQRRKPMKEIAEAIVLSYAVKQDKARPFAEASPSRRAPEVGVMPSIESLNLTSKAPGGQNSALEF